MKSFYYASVYLLNTKKQPIRRIIMYHNFKTDEFEFDGHNCTVVIPENPIKGNPYIWRAEFLGAFDSVDVEMIKRGYHLIHISLSDMFGAPPAIDEMYKFQKFAEEKYSLSGKAIIFGFSRGGLYTVNFTAAHPEKVDKIYLDAPVLDVMSWPYGTMRGSHSEHDVEMCADIYNISDVKEFCGSPIYKIHTLIENKIPVMLVVGDSDTVVPFNENGKILFADYVRYGGTINLIVKKGVGHHPHSLENPKDIADFLCGNGTGVSFTEV